MKKVCVVGLGYIGLPTSIVAAQSGFEVVGFDVDDEKVKRINKLDPVIEEPELLEKLRTALSENNFYATTTVEAADYYVIAVPTPFLENNEADLSYIWQAAESIATVLQKDNTIILESTIPVGTTEKCARHIERLTSLKAGVDFSVAHCPERVLPGKIFHELIHNPRIVGGINKRSVEHAKYFYKKFVEAPLYLTNATTAEMVKLIENSSRDVAIAFANQVAAMAYKQGLDPFEVIELANKHPRVSILHPSCGVGGHCIAVDPWFLMQTFPEETGLLKVARQINKAKPHQVIQTTRHCVQQWSQTHTRPPKILALGLAYKADVDDVRESPALTIVKKLSIFTDMELLVCDPFIPEETIKLLLGISSTPLKKGLEQADIVLCLVGHSKFKAIDQANISQKTVLDFCGIFHKAHKSTENQEQFFWPTSTIGSRFIIDHLQGEL